jgi:hypothetical protein
MPFPTANLAGLGRFWFVYPHKSRTMDSARSRGLESVILRLFPISALHGQVTAEVRGGAARHWDNFRVGDDQGAIGKHCGVTREQCSVLMPHMKDEQRSRQSVALWRTCTAQAPSGNGSLLAMNTLGPFHPDYR